MMQAGRLLDTLVAEKVFRWSFEWGGQTLPIWGGFAPGVQGISVIPHYSTDIGAAWEVVEWLHRMERPIRLSQSLDGMYSAWTWKDDAEVYAPTAPLAICLVALQTVGVKP